MGNFPQLDVVVPILCVYEKSYRGKKRVTGGNLLVYNH